MPWIALWWFPAKPQGDVERIRSVLSQLGTYGDLFGMLNCLFTGGALIGAGYAIVLQWRQLRHQQEEIDRNRIERATAAVWQRRTALIEATSFLAQSQASQLASLQAIDYETLSPEAKIAMAARGAFLMGELQKNIDILSRFVVTLVSEHEEDVTDPNSLRTAYGIPPKEPPVE